MKAVGYLRVSTEHDSQTDSITNQEQLIMNYIRDNDYDLHFMYIDRITATGSKKRPNYNKMLEDGANGKFDIIIAKDISRLTRDTFRLQDFNLLFYKYGIHTVTLDNSINTLVHANLDDAILSAYMSEKTSRDASLKIKGGLKARAFRGFFKGSTPPYGYYIENGVLKVRTDDTPNVVKRIFSDYLKGHGLEKIAKTLFKEKIPTPASSLYPDKHSIIWHTSTVKLILENMHYIGDLCQCKTAKLNFKNMRITTLPKSEHIIVKNTHEGIIPHETFALVQELMTTRSKKVGAYRKSEHLFSGISFCATCGKGMHFRKNRSGYICGFYDKKGKESCTSHHIKEDFLLQLVKNDLKTICSKIDLTLLKVPTTKVQKKIDILKKQVLNFDKQLVNIKQRRINMLNNLSRNAIDKDSYDIFVEALSEEKDLLHANHQLALLEIKSLETLNLSKLNKLREDLLSIETLDKSMLLKLISKIKIKEKGEVEIYYRFSLLLQLI